MLDSQPAAPLVRLAIDGSRDAREVLRLGEGSPAPLLVVVTSPSPDPEPHDLERLFARLRGRASRESVRPLGRDEGYRLEDAAAVVARLPSPLDPAPVRAWLRRRLGSACVLQVSREAGPLVLAASFRARAGAPPLRPRHVRDARGRVRVEAFELHVVEHCNLRCAHCSNISPFVPERTLSVARLRATCARLAPALHADVVKIVGGEPLLHPEITAVIHALRESGIGDRVRLFTNGLRLHAMGDDFWRALDELTISNYSSAPVRTATLERVHERARAHGVVLNVKEVREFSQVASPRACSVEQARAVFERCWLRHRCLIVRDDRFYTCTKAAYAREFLATIAHEPPPAGLRIVRDEDGVALEGPKLAQRIEAYLARTEPLGACHYCNGGDGATIPHHQLTRDQVRAGVLSGRKPVEHA